MGPIAWMERVEVEQVRNKGKDVLNRGEYTPGYLGRAD